MIDLTSREQHMIDRYDEFIKHKMSHDEAIYILRLMFELNPLGFERYVSDYFHKEQSYITKVIGGMNDHGIDVEGSKSVGCKYLYLAIQCKKWFYAHSPIKKDKILEFDDNIKRYRKNYNNKHKLYFVTTTNASKEARKIAQEKKIVLKDCRDLLKMRKIYDFNTFIKDTNKWKNNGERLFTEDNVTETIQAHLYEKTITKRIFQPVYC